MMILVYGMYTAQLIAECYAISEKVRHTHTLSLENAIIFHCL